MTSALETSRTPLRRAERLAVQLAPRFVRLLAATWRVRVVDDAGWRTLRAAGRPIIYALWHGEMLPLLAQHSGEGIAVLISEHHDGEVIARIATALGYRTIRGSTTRGATQALLAVVREVARGGEVAVTPDGPRGPARTFAPGALVAAQRAGAPIVAVGVAVSRAWRLSSWDAFTIPKPFARIAIAYSDPTSIAAATPRAAAQETDRFEELMRSAAERAHAALNGDMRGERQR